MFALALLSAACASDAREVDDPASTASSTSGATAKADSVSATAPSTSSTPPDSTDQHPDVLVVEATRESSGSWRFDVTMSSPYDSPARYADAWRVVGPDGTQYGIRILTHDHANEQPFTRSQTGIVIPEDITVVTIQGRDLVNGWGGGSIDLVLPTG